MFGPVGTPFYSIRFNKNDDIPKEKVRAGSFPALCWGLRSALIRCGCLVCVQLVEGSAVYFVPSLTQFVLPDNTPGSDASNLHDEEVAAHVCVAAVTAACCAAVCKGAASADNCALCRVGVRNKTSQTTRRKWLPNRPESSTTSLLLFCAVWGAELWITV